MDSSQPLDDQKTQIDVLLKQAQKGPDAIQEFAWLLLRQYRSEALAVKTEENVAAARGRLKERLLALLAWATESGRM